MKTVAIIPAFNEASRIADVVRSVAKFVDTVIVINDGSSDTTGSVAAEAGAFVLTHALNCGAGAATMTGILAARALKADAAVTIDADGQHNPEDISRLLEPIANKGMDVVIGSRFIHGGNSVPFVRRVFNGLGNIFTFMVTGRYVSDSQSGYKAFGRKALYEIHLHLSGFEFCSEIIREVQQHHWKVMEIPIRVVYSEYTLAKGQSFSRGVITAGKILLRSFLR